MVYRPRPPKKWFFSYIMPFLLIIIIFIWWIYAFKQLLFKDNNNSSHFNDSYAILATEKWSTEVMLAWTSDWKTAPVKMKLFKWDSVKTYKKEIKIDLPNNIEIYIDKNSSLILNKIEANNSYRDIEISLISWRIWVKAQRMINPKSKLAVNSMDLLITTRWWIFSIEPNTVRAIEGESLIDIIDNDKIIWHVNIWVWQELMLREWEISRVKIWQLPEITALSDEFKISPWYKTNYWIYKSTKEDENVINAIKEEWANDTVSWNLATNIDVIKVENVISEKSLTGESEKENDTQALPENNSTWESKQSTKEESNVEVTWELTIDIENTEIQLKKDQMFSIEWKTSSNAAFVLVNWYKLKKFKKWDNIYKYNAMINWWNLIIWENIIKIETLDSRSIKIEEKQITLTISEMVNDELIEENDAINEEEVLVPKRTTTLQITSPKEWEILSDSIVEIKWIAPEWAVAIFFWEYKLSKFKTWDSEFVYRASWDYWNLKRWKKNSYLIKAIDEDWNVIESVNFSFFSEEK